MTRLLNKQITKPIYLLDNKKINETNLDAYLKILSNHWVIPNISKGFETKNNILWTVQYHGGWLKSMENFVLVNDCTCITNKFLFDKNKKIWFGFLDKPDLSLLSPANKYFDLMSIGFYDDVTLEPVNLELEPELEFEPESEFITKFYVWKSKNLEDILSIVFNNFSNRINPQYKDFSHTNVYTPNTNLIKSNSDDKNNNLEDNNSFQIKINNLEINLLKLQIDSNEFVNKEKQIANEYLKFKIEYLEFKNSFLSRI